MAEIVLPIVGNEYLFPHPSLATEDGLLAMGGDLSPNRILSAYRAGIFPWFNKGDPILWWSPNPRMLLFLDDFKINRSFRKRIENGGFEIKFDAEFSKVISYCQKRREVEGTWLTSSMIEAYEVLYSMGYAHSVESYIDGELVGGLYGVSIGKAFFGESMFANHKDASKVALAALVQRLKRWNFHFIDAQVNTAHLKRLGATLVTREHFLKLLQSSVNENTHLGNWNNEE